MNPTMPSFFLLGTLLVGICHVSVSFNTRGQFSFLATVSGRIGISEGLYIWAHEGALDVIAKVFYQKLQKTRHTLHKTI